MAVGQDDAQLEALQGTAAGQTIQLAADYLSYARERFDEAQFKQALIERLLPTVPRKGKPHPIRSRQPFGKFEVKGRLGKGGMAEVFLVSDPELAPNSTRERDHLLALKVMKKEIAHEGSYVTRFLREASNTALIDHHNVVRVQEVGSVEGRLYFTMELIEGETLKDYMNRGVVDEDTGVQILCQLVDGLMAAHERGIGHRDLKPSNVMLLTSKARFGVELADEFDVTVKITDFGLAEMLDTDVPTDMPEGRFLGTAKYVAPEVVRGEERTLKSDVFSLGILAFQMFAGRPPFRARNKLEYLTANMNAEAPPLDQLTPVTPELAKVVAGMLVKDPARRQGAEALRRDLGRLILRREVGDPIEVHDDPASVFHSSAGPAAVAALGGVEPSKLYVTAGALALVLVALLAMIFGGGGDDPPSSPAPSEVPTTVETVRASPNSEPAGDPVLRRLPDLPRDTFSDRLARIEFEQALAEGDRAWKDERWEVALAQWERAAAACPRELEELSVRVQAATREAASAAASAAERSNDFGKAVREWERALAAGADESAQRALERCRRRVEQEDEVDRRLVEARGLKEEGAVQALLELLPLARKVGRDEAVERALERLGVSRAQIDEALAGDSEEDPAARLRAEALLDQAETLLERGDLSGAVRALDSAERHAGPSDRSRGLRARLDQGGQ